MQIAFVAFANAEVLEKVLDLKEIQVEGCRLRLARAETKEAWRQQKQARGMDRPNDPSANRDNLSARPMSRPIAPGQGYASRMAERGSAPVAPPNRSPPRGGESAHGSNFAHGLGKRERQHDGGVSALDSPRPVCGVGMTLDPATQWSDGCCVVRDIKKDGPLASSGVKLGDLLLRVNDVSCYRMPRDEIKRYVIGPEGSTVELVFERDRKPFSVTVHRTAPPKQTPGGAGQGGANYADDFHKRQRFDQGFEARRPSDENMVSPRGAPPPRDHGGGFDRHHDGPQMKRYPSPRAQREGAAGGVGGGWETGDDRPIGGGRDEWREPPREPRRDAYSPQGRDPWRPSPRDSQGAVARDDYFRDPPQMVRDERLDRRDDHGPDFRMQNSFDSPRGDFRHAHRGSPPHFGRSPPRTGAPYHDNYGPPTDFRRQSRSPPPGFRGPSPGLGRPSHAPQRDLQPAPSGQHPGPAMKRPVDQRLMEHRVFLSASAGGLGWLNRDTIYHAMESFGRVLQVFIPHGKKFAYVSFSDGEGKEAVLRARDLTIDGCTVRCDVARAQQGAVDRFPSLSNIHSDRQHWRDFSDNSPRGDRDKRDWCQISGARCTDIDTEIRDERNVCRFQSAYCNPSRSNPGQRSSDPHCNSLESDSFATPASSSVEHGSGFCRDPTLTYPKLAGDFQPRRSQRSSNESDVSRDKRAGWICPFCRNENFAFRDVCNSKYCRAPRPEADVMASEEQGMDVSHEAIQGGKMQGNRAQERQMENGVIDSEPSLIKPQITWASPQEVMDWLNTTSLDSLSFDDLAQCLVRFSTLLMSAEMQTLSDVSDSQHASPSRVLQQCVGLVPALETRFLALADDSCGTTAVTHSKPERTCQHTITSKTDKIWKCEACGHKNVGSQSVCSNRACSQRRLVIPASSDTVSDSAVAKDMIDGLRVRTAFAGVVQVYRAAVQHCYADCTQQIAREVCARCKDALSCMTARVTMHLNASEADASSDSGLRNSAFNGKLSTSDVLDVLGVFAALAGCVTDIARSALVNHDVADMSTLHNHVCAVGRWLLFRSVHPIPSPAPASAPPTTLPDALPPPSPPTRTTIPTTALTKQESVQGVYRDIFWLESVLSCGQNSGLTIGSYVLGSAQLFRTGASNAAAGFMPDFASSSRAATRRMGDRWRFRCDELRWRIGLFARLHAPRGICTAAAETAACSDTFGVGPRRSSAQESCSGRHELRRARVTARCISIRARRPARWPVRRWITGCSPCEDAAGAKTISDARRPAARCVSASVSLTPSAHSPGTYQPLAGSGCNCCQYVKTARRAVATGTVQAEQAANLLDRSRSWPERSRRRETSRNGCERA